MSSTNSRKSTLAKPSNSPSAHIVLEVVREVVEEVETTRTVNPVNMLQPKPKTRFQRLSKLLFPLQIDSKAVEDAHLRKPIPPPQPLRVASPNRRDAPLPYAISTHDSHKVLPPAPLTTSTKRLQKSDTRNDFPPQPRNQSPARPMITHVPAHSRGNSLTLPLNMPEPGVRTNGSTPISSRPNSAHSGSDSDAGLASKAKKRSSWLPGGHRSKSRNQSQDSDTGHKRAAWIRAGVSTIEYSLKSLTNGEKIPELWTEDADTFIYLHPRSSGYGPSFRVPSFVLSSSKELYPLLHFDGFQGAQGRPKSFDGRSNLAVLDATRNLPIRGPEQSISPDGYDFHTQGGLLDSTDSLSLADTPRETHLYFPTGIMSAPDQFTAEDIQKLVDIRNLFAFLMGQPLVATRQCDETFKIFLVIGALLKQFNFRNLDGSTYGESAETSFTFYLDELKLADVRDSREKTIEGIVLGEAMRSLPLYNEAFAHAVGKYKSIRDLGSPIFNIITPNTRSRLERASMTLQERQKSVALRLTTFEFPSLFAGIASSTTSEESKDANFKAWKLSFTAMRKFVLGYYKDLHGQWPPKASSKKNQFVEGGLNRLVLKVLYNDLCQLYSFLVDTDKETTRSYNTVDVEVKVKGADKRHAALRKMLSEYDRSSPPVQPPLIFDVPLLPTLESIDAAYEKLPEKDRNKQTTRRLKENEQILVLTKSHNIGFDIKTPFMQAYKQFELDLSLGKSAQDLADQRFGIWLFIYAVIQALPMLLVDAPDVRYSDGVEYFLCMPPMGNPAWMEDVPTMKKAWYNVGGGQNVVSLTSDTVNHGIEAVYQKSYCWTMADIWRNNKTAPVQQPVSITEEMLSPLEPPPGMAGGQLGMRPQSRGRQGGPSQDEWINSFPPQNDSRNSSRQRSSVMLGLEELPIPANMSPITVGSPYPAASYAGYRENSPGGYSQDRSASGQRQASSTTQSSHKHTASNTASTFDQILGSMDQPEFTKPGKSKGKKK